MPLFDIFKKWVNDLLDPVWFFGLSVVALGAAIVFRRWWTRGAVAFPLLLISVVFMLVSMTDENFQKIVGKADNIPIVIMLFAVGFFMWLSFRKMVINDDLIASGQPTVEARESRKRVFCWPDLVFGEFLVLILCTVFLLWWGIVVKAPLEEAANPALTPNPSKAPWYFLGLQEMLVYYDPWLAGVVFPTLIVNGLMAIPYIDLNPKGSGYYTFNERPFAIVMFLFGFVVLWVLMIILGTFLRGPNWNFFGPYEYWDLHKLEALNNVNLSEIVWNHWLERPLPKNILVREFPGFATVITFLAILPPILGNTIFRKIYQQIGFFRFNVLVNLFLFMAALPIKMMLRWTLNLKYIVAIPEWFFNI